MKHLQEKYVTNLVVRTKIDCKTVSSFAGRSNNQARSSNGRADGSVKEWDEEPLPHSFSLASARPFPLPSFPFEERAWNFNLLAKERTKTTKYRIPVFDNFQISLN